MNNNLLGRFTEMLKNNKSVDNRCNILIIDGLNLFIRSYSVAPNTNENAIHVGGITGSLLSLGYAIKLSNPAKVYIVFDGKGGSVRRRKLFPEYKSQRRVHKILRPDFYDTAEEDTKQQQYELLRLMDYLHELPVTLISVDNIGR